MSEKPNPFAPHWLIRDIVIGSHIHAAGKGSLLFVGDSIVEGFYWSRVAGCPVVNAGDSGIWTEALLPKVPRLLENTEPCLVVLLVGTNDAKKGRTEAELDEVTEHYDGIVRCSEASGAPIILVTPPPVEAGKRLTGFYSAEAMSSLSRRIVAVAERHGTGIIDMHAAFSGPGPEAHRDATVDGIHLSPGAYARLRDMLELKAVEMTSKGRLQRMHR